MEKIISVEKMSKKAQKAYYARQRRDWNGLSPVTRCPANPKAYNRSRLKKAMNVDY